MFETDEPSPVEIWREEGRSPFVVVCDHAGRALPRSLGTLGLSPAALASHIAWDIGAVEVARRLADKLDAVLFTQRYSRLVIDCNRPLSAHDSIAAHSGGIPIPGNQSVTEAQARERARRVFQPYHERIRCALDERLAQGMPSLLVSVHSFTPELFYVVRPWHAGVLYLRDGRLARPVLELLQLEHGLVVGDNQPYAASELSDFSIVEHGERRGAPYVELEIRQDLIDDAAKQEQWADRFAELLPRASATFQAG